MKQLKRDLNINEKFTRVIKRDESFNKVKQCVPLVKGYNYMADLLFLPTTKFGYKYLLVMTDLASNACDFEQIKNKEPDTILKAMLKIFTRPYLKKPEASIKTDSGTEFKGAFDKYCYDNSIYHSIGIANRHKALSNVENLNKTLGTLINGYMNHIEEENGKVSKDWLPCLDTIREQLNEIRIKKLPKDITKHEYSFYDPVKIIDAKKKLYQFIKPKYRVNQLVYYKLDYPENILGTKQPTATFRQGDRRLSMESHHIKQIIYMNTKPWYRYILHDVPNVSFSENELKP